MAIKIKEKKVFANGDDSLEESLDLKETDYSTKISNDYGIDHSIDSKPSCFARILCLYTLPLNKKETYEAPLSFADKQNCNIGKNFKNFYVNYFQKYAQPVDFKYCQSNENLRVFKIPGHYINEFTGLSSQIDIMAMELIKKNESHIRGLICTTENDNLGVPDFSNWFMYHLLEVSKMDYRMPLEYPVSNSYHETVAAYFNANLKNEIKNDLWEAQGKYSFMEKLKYFTERMLPIQAILPAFPCKSTNLQKVIGTEPDLGEYFALETLINFCNNIKRECYYPGFKIWIVSDGHVFSDCIGANDKTVDKFTSELHKMYLHIKDSYGKKTNSVQDDCIGFFGLKDVFYSEASGQLFEKTWLESVKLEHYIETEIDPESEMCRKIMMAACDTDNGRLSRQVKIANHPRLLLYRGFTKFMEEDISKLAHVSKLSRKQQKKLAAKTAFEMIKRNDAYSNLVDLCFPHYMRLSIHAHPNSGPKYGIKVVDPKKCKVIKTFDDLSAPSYDDFLHIPTPWHNAVIKNTQSNRYYFGRSNIVAKAIQSKCFLGKIKKNGVGSAYYEISTRTESDVCEYDECNSTDAILSKLRENFLETNVVDEIADIIPNDNSDMKETKPVEVATAFDYDSCMPETSLNKSKSSTLISEETFSVISKIDTDNMTPLATELDDGESKIETKVESLSLQSENA